MLFGHAERNLLGHGAQIGTGGGRQQGGAVGQITRVHHSLLDVQHFGIGELLLFQACCIGVGVGMGFVSVGRSGVFGHVGQSG